MTNAQHFLLNSFESRGNKSSWQQNKNDNVLDIVKPRILDVSAVNRQRRFRWDAAALHFSTSFGPIKLIHNLYTGWMPVENIKNDFFYGGRIERPGEKLTQLIPFSLKQEFLYFLHLSVILSRLSRRHLFVSHFEIKDQNTLS